MLRLRLLPIITQRCHAKLFVKTYGKNVIPAKLIRQVDPNSNIKIISNYHLNIKPYDLLDCPNGNLLRISVQTLDKVPPSTISSDLEQFIKNFNASIEIDDRNIIIDTKDELNKRSTVQKLSNDLICVIEVPVKSNLKVTAHRDVHVQNLYSDDILITTSDGNITTKNIHSVNLNLIAENGNVRCEGNTLAHKMDVRAFGDKVWNSFTFLIFFSFLQYQCQLIFFYDVSFIENPSTKNTRR